MDLVAPDGYVYIEICQAMYGLQQSGRLANIELEKVIGKQGYYSYKYTPGLYFHKTCFISFTLIVDEFGVKYVNKEDTLYLEKTIQDHYSRKSDSAGESYIGIDLKWDYDK